MRQFYLAWPPEQIWQTPVCQISRPEIPRRHRLRISADRQNSETLSRNSIDLPALANAFPLPWSAYVRLLSVKNELARAFLRNRSLALRLVGAPTG
jgi:hypothetical protein